ncbi:hypothetical protein LWI29_015018 [Acer saccharum]|uniref:Bet v I/Major latex protein domain-containing protein n=1 Tax=Acer saccharum TaxID=4024 RepID=A0AA39VDJ1_ACESA|nr:hypothetical protein LWI29_015018 [Acer saccharum]KAK1553381.1 hypothetical protein Q3G72_033987 [Acer saccharum]
MALSGKLEADIEIKAPAEKYFNIFKAQCEHLPNISSSNIQGVDLHEGDWDTHGSVKLWKYTVEGREESYKEKVEIDDENLSVTLVGLEGDVFKNYKSWKATFQATPKGDGSSVIKHILEYEKLNQDVPVPNPYLDFLVSITKDIASHLDN